MQLLKANVEQWADDRNLIRGSTPKKQLIKLVEEFGELASGIARGDIDKIKDSIGDCAVVAIIMAKQCGGSIDFTKVPQFAPVTYTVDATEHLCRATGYLGAIADGLYTMEQTDRAPIDRLVGFLSHLFMIGVSFEVSLEHCLATAWNEIKDRKGRMVDGVFIKEEDL